MKASLNIKQSQNPDNTCSFCISLVNTTQEMLEKVSTNTRPTTSFQLFDRR